jgi:uncharacterized damage-inducible protein DinB
MRALPMNYTFKTYFLMLAHYNQRANQKLFSTLIGLTEEQLNQDCKAYFKSLMQTANHVLVGDILWFERINGVVASTYALDGVLYNQLAQLENARIEHDQILINFIHEHDEVSFHQAITYVRRGQVYTEPLIEILAHVFNHQTHHRGQMHNMIFELTATSLELDLIFFQREYAYLYR